MEGNVAMTDHGRENDAEKIDSDAEVRRCALQLKAALARAAGRQGCRMRTLVILWAANAEDGEMGGSMRWGAQESEVINYAAEKIAQESNPAGSSDKVTLQ
jgi:hypothetical protein